MEQPATAETAGKAAGGVHMSRAVELLAEEPLPLTISRWTVCPTDGIRRENAPRALLFHFDYDGYAFKCEIEPGESRPLVMRAAFGHLPFTVESPERRRLAASLLHLAGKLPSGRLALDPVEGLVLIVEKALPNPFRPTDIMAAVTALLLEIRPWLALLEECLPPLRRRSGSA